MLAVLQGRGDAPITKVLRSSSDILKTTSKTYQDPVLWAWLEYFPPPRGTNNILNNTVTGTFVISKLF